MGTPDFAVPSLELLIQNHYEVVAVVTAPDKPAGRGNQLKISEVKECALKYGLPLLQPEKLKALEFIEELRSYKADLQVIVAFRMLPEVVWSMPGLGSINLHASLLPNYRGAAPINWAIINGETETGLTTFFLQQEIDTGNILFQEKEAILPEDDFGTLYEKLKNKGAELVVRTVRAIEKGNYTLTPQDFSKTYPQAPKIFRETCEINWNQPALQIHNLVRGLSPVPAAWTNLLDKNCKIYKTRLTDPKELETVTFQAGKEPGDYVTDNKSFLYFKTADSFLSIQELQLEGKKKMDIRAFLAGNKLN